MIATTPTAGKQYKIKPGDELNKIASIAYGQPDLWPKIYNANQTTLKSNDPDLIFPGEIILIPSLTELTKLKNERIKKTLEKQGKDSIKLIIGDFDVKFQEISITRTMDTCADGWQASIAWNPGEDENLDRITKPYSYENASIYLGGNLIINGSLYSITPTLTDSQRGKLLEGWSFTADAIDSSIKPPYEVTKTSLKQRAEQLVSAFGISVVWDLDDDLIFDKMTAGASDTVFEHLLKYAKQKGKLISSTPEGNMHFIEANTKGQSVGTITDGEDGFLEYSAKFDGRKRFNSYKAIGQSPKSSKKFEIAKDDQVPKSRMTTFNNPDSTEGDLKKSAEWQRSISMVEALTIPFTATSFYAPNGERWQENTIVTVKSKILSIPEGFNFLIKRIEYNKSASGNTTKLDLVPPQVYSGDPLPDIFK